MRSEVENIVDELKRCHDGQAWHGSALREILAGVTAEQAAARPIANAHSIWELVLHIAAWEEVMCRRLEGQPANEPEEGDFPPVDDVSQQAWAQALEKLNRAHERVKRMVSELPDSALTQTVVGKNHSVSVMLYGIIQHHVYHGGQISLLKKMLDAG